MEDTLRAIGVANKENRNGVLILVLMEDTLRAIKKHQVEKL